MSELVMVGDTRSFLMHFAAYGLSAILESELGSSARVAMTSLRSLTVTLDDPRVTPLDMAAAVQSHAAARIDSWVTRTHMHADRESGTMSPRLKTPSDRVQWEQLQRARHLAIDSVPRAEGSWLDLDFMGALGEPAYWYLDNVGKSRPDAGASSWEMKTRNRGEEFTQNRLALLCKAVAGWETERVLAGLTGAEVNDDVGKNAVDSRTPTGLARPGATDNALAWCALWGISFFPVTHRAAPGPGTSKGSGQPSLTAGTLRGLPRAEPQARAFTYLPLFRRPQRLARVKTLVASGALARVSARKALLLTQPGWSDVERKRWSATLQALARPADQDWLRRKGCDAILLSHVHASDNPNAPELHVVEGRIHPIWEE